MVLTFLDLLAIKLLFRQTKGYVPYHEHRLPQWQAVAKVGVYSHDVLFVSQVQTSQMNQTGNPPPGALLLH